MKKKIFIIGMVFILILLNAVTCFAAETTVQLVSDKSEVKAGETFTVTIKAVCDEGINGLDTAYSYDEEKLELVSTNVGANFSNLSTGNEISLISISTEKITSADLFTLTFKVKEGVAVDSTAQIGIDETLLGSDAATDSNHMIDAQNITVTVVSGITLEPDEPVDPENPGNPETPGEDEGEGEGTTPPGEEQKPTTPEQETVPGTTVVVGGDKNDDSTVSDKDLPDTGINVIVIASAIVVAIVIAIILYKKNKDYQFIK